MGRVTTLFRSEIGGVARKNRPTIVLVSLLVTIILAAQAVIGAGLAKFAQDSQEHSALALIELSGTSPQARTELTPANLKALAATPGIEGVYPHMQCPISLDDPAYWPEKNTHPGGLWATPLVPGLEPKLVAGRIPSGGLGPDQIIIPDRVPGGSLTALLDKQVTFTYTKVIKQGEGEGAPRVFTVVGIADNSVIGRDGPTPAYVTLSAIPTIGCGHQDSYSGAFVKVHSAAEVPAMQTNIAAAGYAVSSLATDFNSLGGVFALLRAVEWVFLVLLGIICLSVGWTAGAIWIRQRFREIGTLKAIGWTRPMILGVITGELAAVGLIAALIGLALGTITSLAATTIAAAANIEIMPVVAWQLPPWQSLLLAALAVPIFVTLGGILNATKAANLDPDDIIRSAH